MKKLFKLQFLIIDNYEKILHNIFSNINLNKYNCKNIRSEIYYKKNDKWLCTWDIYGENELREIVSSNEMQNILEIVYCIKSKNETIYFEIYTSHECTIICNDSNTFEIFKNNIISNKNYKNIMLEFDKKNIIENIKYFKELK